MSKELLHANHPAVVDLLKLFGMEDMHVTEFHLHVEYGKIVTMDATHEVRVDHRQWGAVKKTYVLLNVEDAKAEELIGSSALSESRTRTDARSGSSNPTPLEETGGNKTR